MQETEVWSEISKEEFEKKLKEFTEKFGEPSTEKRLGIGASDYNRTDMYNRIRITNGEPELMQKVGDWQSISKTELKIGLPKDAEQILNMFKAIVNCLDPKGDIVCPIIQMENFVFLQKDFEVKLTHQTGKTDLYSFEVELLNEKKDILEVCKDLGLKPDLSEKDGEFWKAHNEKLNLDAKVLDDEHLLNIISSYLN